MLFSQCILKYKSTGAILRQILIKNHEDDVVEVVWEELEGKLLMRSKHITYKYEIIKK